VIAAVRAVPDSPWAIVSKVDTLEVLEPVTERIWYVVGTCILVVLATGMAQPLQVKLAPDGRIFFNELKGPLKIWKPATQTVVEAGAGAEAGFPDAEYCARGATIIARRAGT
jgi:hypothetical protein